jgi:ribosomal RNA-processing protein 36
MLRKAQRTLAQARALSDSESDSDPDASFPSDDNEAPRSTTVESKGKEKPERDSKTRRDHVKRSSKHA